MNATKRFRQRVFRWGEAASSLLFIAVVMFWIGSYWRGGGISGGFGHGVWIDLVSWPGAVSLAIYYPDVEQDSARIYWESWPATYILDGGAGEAWGNMGQTTLGFHWYWWSGRGGFSASLLIPCWALALTTAILPALSFFFRGRDRGRAAAGHCTKCGYDLRASKDACPECGTPIH